MSRKSKVFELVRRLTQQLSQVLTKSLGPIADSLVGSVLQSARGLLSGNNKDPNKKRLFAANIAGEGRFRRSNVSAYDVRLQSLTFEGGLEFKMPGKEKAAPFDFNVSFKGHIRRLAKDAALACAGGKLAELLDLDISADVPLKLTKSLTLPAQFSVGSILKESGGAVTPTGFRGGLKIDGDIKLAKVTLKRPGFALAIGELETYFAARCGLKVGKYELEGAAFLGKFCSIAPIKRIDPKMAQQICPCQGRVGGYFRAYGNFPLIDMGCLLNASVGAGLEFGMFGPKDPTGAVAYGGSLFARAQAEALCSISAVGELQGKGGKDGDDWNFSATGWVAAGVGWCDPSGWKTSGVAKQDDWCLECGAGLGVCMGSDADTVVEYDAGCERQLSVAPPTCKTGAICTGACNP